MIERYGIVNMVTYHIVRMFLGIFVLRVNLFYSISQICRILWMCLHIRLVLVPQQLLILPLYLVLLESKSVGQINSNMIF